MLSKVDIKGLDLPPKTLCLTYDDGPSEHSAEIGRFLAARGVRATFFVVGRFAAERPDVLDELHRSGHILGNHTYEHPDMPYYVSVKGDIRDQIIRTNALLQRYNRNKVTFLRATYGKWSPEVANELNMDLRTSYRHAGPVYWDVDGIDCHFWRIGKTVQEAMDAYLDNIAKQERGIVVMHDGVADMDTVAALTQTLELTKRLVPVLQERGYKFVGLDEIEDAQLTTSSKDTFSLRGQNGRLLHAVPSDDFMTWSGTQTSDRGVQLTLEHQPDGKVTLQTVDGRYLTSNADIDSIVRLKTGFDRCSLFELIPVRDGQSMIRTFNGNYLASSAAAPFKLEANAQFMRQAWCIAYVPTSDGYAKPQSVAQRFDLAKRRLRFIRSKLLPS